MRISEYLRNPADARRRRPRIAGPIGDSIIRDYGGVLFMVWAVLSIIAIAWILSGGLRRRLNRNRIRYALVAVLITETPAAPGRLSPSPACPPPIPVLDQHRELKDGEKSDDSNSLAFPM